MTLNNWKVLELDLFPNTEHGNKFLGTVHATANSFIDLTQVVVVVIIDTVEKSVKTLPATHSDFDPSFIKDRIAKCAHTKCNVKGAGI